MAKGSKSGRGLFTPIRPLSPSRLAPLSRVRVTPVDLRIFEDRRTLPAPFRFAPPAALRRPAVRVFDKPKRFKTTPRLRALHTPGTLSFAAPDKVLVCVRRRRRKEVLFAKNKAGKRGQRKPRRNYWSSISCR